MFLINIKPNKCDKVILENHRTLKPVPDCYKNHEMCNNYPHALGFVCVCHETQMYDKAVNTYNAL